MGIPYRFDPLGTLGGELPPGYTPLEYALFDGGTAVDTEFKIATPCWFVVDFQATDLHSDAPVLGWRSDMKNNTRIGFGLQTPDNRIYLGRGGTFPDSQGRHEAGYNRTVVELRAAVEATYYGFNGEALKPDSISLYNFSSELNIWLGITRHGGEEVFFAGYKGKIFRVLFKDETGRVVADIRPALHNGSPCFFDVVRRFELTVVKGALKQ